MSIEDVFPSNLTSRTEEAIVIEAFSNPAIKKYLRSLALNDTKELLQLSAIATTNESIIKAHAVVQGKLQVIATLLSIEASQPAVSNPSHQSE